MAVGFVGQPAHHGGSVDPRQDRALGIEIEIGTDESSFSFKTSVTMPAFREKMETGEL